MQGWLRFPEISGQPASSALGRQHQIPKQAAAESTSLPRRRDIDRDLAHTVVDWARRGQAYTGPGSDSAFGFRNQRKSASGQKARTEAVPIMRRIPEAGMTCCQTFCVDHGNCGGVRPFRFSRCCLRQVHRATTARRRAMPTNACTTVPPDRIPMARPSLS